MTGPDRMREKLRELGRSVDAEFAPEIDARIVEHVKLHGPGTVRRSRQRRAVLRVGALVLPVALGVVGWRVLGGDGRVADAVVARSSAPVAGAAAVAVDDHVNVSDHVAVDSKGVRVAATCAQHVVGSSSFAAAADGRRVLELAERGRAVLEQGAEAQLDARDPCRLALQLVRGRVTVHAKNLMGGELRVQAGGADVVVHGTTFAVERVADDVSVDVAEGAVAVEREGRAVAPLLRTGQRLQVAVQHAPVLLALSEAESAQLRAAVSEIVVPREPSAATDETASNVPAAAEVVAERPRRTTVRSRTSTSASPRSSSRFAASRGSSSRSTEGGDTESDVPDTSASAGTARAIGSAAWQRALADSSSAARTVLPPSAAAGRKSAPTSDASSSSPARPSDESAAPGSSPAARSETSTAVEAVPRGEIAAAAETGTRAEAAPRTEPPARAETPAELVARADSLWRRGSRDDARTLYRRAGSASGATAQAAWLALARRELAAGHASAARAALDGYTVRFPSGALSEEAAGIEFRIALLEHDDVLAERVAKRLCERHPDSPAAQAAARWLRKRGHGP